VDSKALRPNFNIKAFVEQEKIKGKPISDEEKELFSLTSIPGWKIVNDYANRVMAELDGTIETAVASGAPFEEIGRNTVVINLAKDIIKRILDRVNDARDACQEQIDNEK